MGLFSFDFDFDFDLSSVLLAYDVFSFLDHLFDCSVRKNEIDY